MPQADASCRWFPPVNLIEKPRERKALKRFTKMSD